MLITRRTMQEEGEEDQEEGSDHVPVRFSANIANAQHLQLDRPARLPHLAIHNHRRQRQQPWQ